MDDQKNTTIGDQFGGDERSPFAAAEAALSEEVAIASSGALALHCVHIPWACVLCIVARSVKSSSWHLRIHASMSAR